MTTGLNNIPTVEAIGVNNIRKSVFLGTEASQPKTAYGVPLTIDFVDYEPLGSPNVLGPFGIKFNFTSNSSISQLLPGGIAGIIIDTTTVFGIPAPIVGPPYLAPNLQTFVYFPDTGYTVYCPWFYQVHAPVFSGSSDFIVYLQGSNGFRFNTLPPISIMPVNMRIAPYIAKRYPQPGLSNSAAAPTTVIDIR